MPPDLLREILDEALKDASPQQRVVVDLCAGFGSLREPVMERGLTYVPVGIRQLPWMHSDSQGAIGGLPCVRE